MDEIFYKVILLDQFPIKLENKEFNTGTYYIITEEFFNKYKNLFKIIERRIIRKSEEDIEKKKKELELEESIIKIDNRTSLEYLNDDSEEVNLSKLQPYPILYNEETIVTNNTWEKINLINIDISSNDFKKHNNKINRIIFIDPYGNNNEKDIFKYAASNKNNSRSLLNFLDNNSSLFAPDYEYIGRNYIELLKRVEQEHTDLLFEEESKNWFLNSVLKSRIKVNCTTVDKILTNEKDCFHLLKSNTNGSEFQILEGAKEYLKNQCLALQLNCFVVPMFKGIKLKKEIVRFLNDYNFREYKILKKHGTFLSQEETLFIKKDIENKYMETIKEIYKQNE